jgi:hypothetical protein
LVLAGTNDDAILLPLAYDGSYVASPVQQTFSWARREYRDTRQAGQQFAREVVFLTNQPDTRRPFVKRQPNHAWIKIVRSHYCPKLKWWNLDDDVNTFALKRKDNTNGYLPYV